MVQILAVRVRAPEESESDVIAFRWYNPESGNMSDATLDVMLTFFREQSGIAYTCNGRTINRVVVDESGVHSFLRIETKNGQSESLLNLPRF